MDRWFLIAATLLAAVGGILGMISVHRGKRNHWTVAWMIAALLCQIGFLAVRGELRDEIVARLSRAAEMVSA